ncbi:glycosyltransferase family 2 protein [Paenibacillus sp. GbtcB18]|uniref:glycosyltransferase family 2 protein n=1 Tax=Paenibacillus sp. GbtcB18 TaxID=2824763 RepID=UPI0028160FC6|nr:glycosyltransferase family 2 protein [Paenibacillus sp. GbtcB18]
MQDLDRKDKIPTLFIVVPCYNEEEVLFEAASRLSAILTNLMESRGISNDSRVMFVDDGSKDKTWMLISELSERSPHYKGLKLAKNVGHQNALLAGLHFAKDYCDIAISIDADLQDDVEAISEFIEKYHEGYDVVYGVRNNRDTDTYFKKMTAQGFYKIMSKMGVDLVYNHADYRLMSKRVLEELTNFTETNLFIRGIVPLIGFKSTEVYYKRHERFAGISKYPLKKMVGFAMNGVTSFSVTPIRFVSFIGFLVFLTSILAAMYTLYAKITGQTVSGWASLMVSIWFLGGIQLMSLGLIGEYIGKIYKESKRRPKYIVEKTV